MSLCPFQECPTGYHGKHCSRKCSPTFGEDCQSVCQCPNVECHFVSGCYKRPEKKYRNWYGFLGLSLHTKIYKIIF